MMVKHERDVRVKAIDDLYSRRLKVLEIPFDRLMEFLQGTTANFYSRMKNAAIVDVSSDCGIVKITFQSPEWDIVPPGYDVPPLQFDVCPLFDHEGYAIYA